MIPNNQFFKSVPPSGGGSVLQPWYDGLLVKPSEGLWTDLKIMADGMNEDGDWSEADLFGVTAALETDEQRLRPFKTTSGDDCVLEGAPGLSINGLDNPLATDVNGLNLKWNPTDNGVKYTLDDAYIGMFGITKSSIISTYRYFGSFNEDVSLNKYTAHLSIVSTSTSMRLDASSINNLNTLTNTLSKTGLLNATKTFFVGLKRLNTTTVTRFSNGTSSNESVNSGFLANIDFGLNGYYYEDAVTPLYFQSTSANNVYFRGYIAGSSLIDHNRVAARLNTFFSARGLSIANY